MEDKLKSFYDNVSPHVDGMPDYDTWVNDMQDEDTWNSFHGALGSVFDNLPESDVLYNELGVKKKQSPDSGQELEEVSPQSSEDSTQFQSAFPEVSKPWLDIERPPSSKGGGWFAKTAQSMHDVTAGRSVGQAKEDVVTDDTPPVQDKSKMMIFPLEDKDKNFIEDFGESVGLRKIREEMNVPERVYTIMEITAQQGFVPLSPPVGLAPSEQDEWWRQRTLRYFSERDTKKLLDQRISVLKDIETSVDKKTGREYLRDYGFREEDLPSDIEVDLDKVLDRESYYELYSNIPSIHEQRMSRLSEWGVPDAIEYQGVGMSMGSSMGKMFRLFSAINDERNERYSKRYQDAGIEDPSLIDALRVSKFTDYIPVVEWMQKDESGETLISAGQKRYADRMGDIRDWLSMREDPLWLEDLAVGIGAVILDAPVFRGSSIAFNAPFRLLGSMKYVNNSLTALGVTKNVADKVTLNALNVLRSGHSMGGALAGHGITNSLLEQLSEDDIDDVSYREALTDGLKSYPIGLAVGGMNFGAMHLANRLYNREVLGLLNDAPDASKILSGAASKRTAVQAGAFVTEASLFEAGHAVLDSEYDLTWQGVGQSMMFIGGLRMTNWAKGASKRVSDKKQLIKLTPDEMSILGVNNAKELKAKYKNDAEFNKLFEDKAKYPLTANLKVAYATGRGRLLPEQLMIVTDVVKNGDRIEYLGHDGSLVDVVTRKGNPVAYAKSGEHKMVADYNRNMIELTNYGPERRNEVDRLLIKSGIEKGLSAREGVMAALRGDSGHTPAEMKFIRSLNDVMKGEQAVLQQKVNAIVKSGALEVDVPVPNLKGDPSSASLKIEGDTFKVTDKLSNKPTSFRTSREADIVLENIKNERKKAEEDLNKAVPDSQAAVKLQARMSVLDTKQGVVEYAKTLMGKEGKLERQIGSTPEVSKEIPEAEIKPVTAPSTESKPKVDTKPVTEEKAPVTSQEKPKTPLVDKEGRAVIVDAETGTRYVVAEEGNSFRVQASKEVTNRAVEIKLRQLEDEGNKILEVAREDAMLSIRKAHKPNESLFVDVEGTGYTVKYKKDGTITATSTERGEGGKRKNVTNKSLLEKIKKAADADVSKLSEKQMELYEEAVAEAKVDIRRGIEAELRDWQTGRAEMLRDKGVATFGEYEPIKPMKGDKVSGVGKKDLPSAQSEKQKMLIDVWEQYKRELKIEEEASAKGKRVGVKEAKEQAQSRSDRLKELLNYDKKVGEDVRKEAREAGLVEGTPEYRKYVSEEASKRKVINQLDGKVLQRMTDYAAEAHKSDALFKKAYDYIDKALTDASFRKAEQLKIGLEKDIELLSDVQAKGAGKKKAKNNLTIPSDTSHELLTLDRINRLIRTGTWTEFETKALRDEVFRLEARKDLTVEESARLKSLRSGRGKEFSNPAERIEKNLNEIISIEEGLTHKGKKNADKGLSKDDVERLDFLREQNRILNYADLASKSMFELQEMYSYVEGLRTGQALRAKRAGQVEKARTALFNEDVKVALNMGRKEGKEKVKILPEYKELLEKQARSELTAKEQERLTELDSKIIALDNKLQPNEGVFKEKKNLSTTLLLQQNFPSLLNILMGNDPYKGGELPLYNDRLNERFSPSLARASNQMYLRQTEFHNDFVKSLGEIIGMKGPLSETRLKNALISASGDKKIEVNLIDRNGKILPHRLTTMQAIEKLFQWDDVDGRRSMMAPKRTDGKGMGYTEQSIKDIRKQLTEKDVLIMDWIKNTWDFYADVYDQAYIKENGISFRKPGYNWVLHKINEGTTLTEVGQGHADRTIRQDRVKNRVKNDASALRDGDALRDLYDFIGEAIRYEAYAKPLREMQYTFKDASVRNTIANNYGTKPLQMIDDYIEIFAGNSAKSREHAMDVLVGYMARGTLGFKASPVLKQMVSSIYYAVDMPVGEFAKSFAALPLSGINKMAGGRIPLGETQRAAVSILRKHPFYLDRVSSMAEATGQEVRDILSRLHRTDVSTKFQKRMLWPSTVLDAINLYSTGPLKAGDIMPVISAGSGYMAHKFKSYSGKALTMDIANKYLNNTLDLNTKIDLDRAVGDWNFFTMMTQQSTNPMNRTYASTLGPWARAATLYTSGPLAAHRTAMYFARDAEKAFKANDYKTMWEATKGFLLFHSVSGASFALVDNWISGGNLIPRDGDDWKNVGFGAALGNLSGLYMLGKYVDYARRSMLDITYHGKPNTLSVSPVLDQLDRLAYTGTRLYESLTTPVIHYPDFHTNLKTFGTAMTTASGVPLDGVLKIWSGVGGATGKEAIAIPEYQEEQKRVNELNEQTGEDNVVEFQSGKIRQYGWDSPRAYGMFSEQDTYLQEMIPDSISTKQATLLGGKIKLPFKVNISAFKNDVEAKNAFLGLVGFKGKSIRVADTEDWIDAIKRSVLSDKSDRIPYYIDYAFRQRTNSYFASKYGVIDNFTSAQVAIGKMLAEAESIKKKVAVGGLSDKEMNALSSRGMTLESDAEILQEIVGSWFESIDQASKHVETGTGKIQDWAEKLQKSGFSIKGGKGWTNSKGEEDDTIFDYTQDVDEDEGLIEYGVED